MTSITQFLETLQNTFSGIDFSKLTDFAYLTEPRPESFAFSSLFILLILLDLVVVGAIYILLKRRFIVLMGKRKLVLRKALKFNFIFCVIWLIFILARFQGILYLSMRLWHLLFLLVFIIGNLLLVIMFLTSKKVGEEKSSGRSGFNYYQDYLPKKNKKRKH